MSDENFIRTPDTLTRRPPVAMQIRGRISAQNLRGAARVEQQLRSRVRRFIEKQSFFHTGTFCAIVLPAIDGGMMCLPPMKQKNQNTNYPREENVR